MKNKLTIGLPTGTFLPNVGGVEAGLHNIATRLKILGHRPIIIASLKSYIKLIKMKANLPYEVIPFPPKLGSLLKSYSNATLFFMDFYWRIIQRNFKIDVWHCTTAFPIGITIGHFAKQKNNPYLVRSVGSDIQKCDSVGYGSRFHVNVDRLVINWLPQANYVIAMTDTIVNEYNKLGIDNRKIKRISNGVDIKRFKISVNKRHIRKLNDIPIDCFVFLTVGRNHPKKGFKYIIDAVKSLSLITDKKFCCVFVGEGFDELILDAKSKNISHYFRFLGKMDDLKQSQESYEFPNKELINIYKASDAFLFPSLIESFGIVLVEAMAASLPIITTDAPGCRDIIKHGIHGSVVPIKNSKCLAEAMNEFLEKPDMLINYALENEQEASKYDWDKVVEKYESSYFEMLYQIVKHGN